MYNGMYLKSWILCKKVTCLSAGHICTQLRSNVTYHSSQRWHFWHRLSLVSYHNVHSKLILKCQKNLTIKFTFVWLLLEPTDKTKVTTSILSLFIASWIDLAWHGLTRSWIDLTWHCLTRRLPDEPAWYGLTRLNRPGKGNVWNKGWRQLPVKDPAGIANF